MSAKKRKSFIMLDSDSDSCAEGDDGVNCSQINSITPSNKKQKATIESEVVDLITEPWTTQSSIAHINSAERFMLFQQTITKFNLKPEIQKVRNNMKTTRQGACFLSTLKDRDEHNNVRVSLSSEVLVPIRNGWNEEKSADTNKISYVIKPAYALKWKELFSNQKMYVPANRGKVGGHWLSALLSNIYPDTTRDGWQKFQCSHLCAKGDCLSPEHLVWETAADNQSRGNPTCRKICTHAGCSTGYNICRCNGIHHPPCI